VQQHLTHGYVLQNISGLEGSTGITSMCLSPGSACAAIALKSNGRMELHIADLSSGAEEASQVDNITKRYVLDLPLPGRHCQVVL
jgi:hypothetical protein